MAESEPVAAIDGQVASQQPIDFVTLGMFIIDEIEYRPPKPPVKDILGGAGSYSALGARLLSPGSEAATVGWIVDQGSDFPDELTETISSWKTTVLLRQDDTRLTTRGWNGYDEAERRAFKYTTPKKRLTGEDLSPEFLSSKSFHIISSPSRCRDLVTDILSRRRKVMGDGYNRPFIIWEPVPDRCTPDELLNCTNCLPVVDVCSPNHDELAGLMGDPDCGLDPATGRISTAAVERACEQLLASMPLQSFSLVVRAGDRGCYVARNGGRKRLPQADGFRKKTKKTRDLAHHGGLQHDTDMEALFAGLLQDEEGAVAREEIEIDPGVEKWIPAYYTSATAEGEDAQADDSKVVDPTGAGNAFLGGLAVGLARGQSIEDAAVWGTVAASFALEQVGVPKLCDEDGTETWNGVSVQGRLQEFRERLTLS